METPQVQPDIQDNILLQFYNSNTKESLHNISITGLYKEYIKWYTNTYGKKEASKVNMNDFKISIKRICTVTRAQSRDTGNKQVAILGRSLI